MRVVPRRVLGFNAAEFETQIESVEGPLSIRYLWFSHASQHEEFIQGYFERGNAHHINIREQTKHLAPLWKPHNAAIIHASRTGDLLWRAKALNRAQGTVDHIEVWRDSDTIQRYFHGERLDFDGQVWSKQNREQLAEGIAATGIVVHTIDSLPISEDASRKAFAGFLERSKRADACIIETNLK